MEKELKSLFQQEGPNTLVGDDERKMEDGAAYLGIFRGAGAALIIAVSLWLILAIVLVLVWR